MLILVSGLPGSGKSFFSRTLSAETGMSYLNSDLLRKELFPLQRTYSEQEKQAVYAELLFRAEQVLKQQKDIIIDATFYKNVLRLPFYQLAEKLSAHIIIFYIQADETLIRERTSTLRHDSEADYQVYLKLKNQFEPFDRSYHTLTSGRNNIADMIASARSYACI